MKSETVFKKYRQRETLVLTSLPTTFDQVSFETQTKNIKTLFKAKLTVH